MKLKVVLAMTALLLASCVQTEPPEAPSAVSDQVEVIAADEPEPEDPGNPSKRRLPESVVIVSDTEPNFGIDISKLSPEHADIVASAWRDYQTILSGGEPKCTEAFGVSDGGTIGYYCDGYDITRAHTLASKDGVDGFDYGPMLDLLNGQRVERTKFYSQQQLAELERDAP
jgi:hypothetical protein